MKKYILRRMAFMTLGALLTAIGLEIFLIPNSIIDGGVIGISIISSHLTGFPLGIFILLLNLPFLWIGYDHIGKTFALSTLYSVSCLALFVNFFHPISSLTHDCLLASVFGGIIVGIGVGTIIRYGGSLDGTEIVAILINRKTAFSVGEIVMFFNLFILASAGFVFGWDRAMYSLIAYFIAFKMMDVAIEGLNESKSVTIISEYPDVISQVIQDRLGRGVTHLYGKGGYTGEAREVLYCVMSRLEISKLKAVIAENDPKAFIAIENVHDVMGGRFSRKINH
ncbi:MAG: YitT family protein [bacterium]